MVTKGEVREKRRHLAAGFEDGERGLGPRIAGSLQKPEKVKQQFLPCSLQRKPALPAP